MKLLFNLVLLFVSAITMAQDRELVISDIIVTGNRKTKENIILRELTFQKGDTILSPELESKISRSRENLLNTSLFNYATIVIVSSSSDLIGLVINVEERWYTWPSLILKYEDRNFSAWLKAKDLSRSKYGFAVEKYNCFGRKENLRFSFLFGYAKQFELSYRNIALDKNRRHFIGAFAELLQQDEIIFNTIDNEPVTLTNSFKPVYEKRKYTVNYTYRPYYYEMHNFYLNYFAHNVSDTVIKLNPDFLGRNIRNMEGFTFDYVFSDDRRDSRAYPLTGSYFELLVGQTVSLPFSKSSFTSTVIAPAYYKYLQLGNRLYYAGGINLKLSYNNTYSYLYSRSLGYLINLHGFEYNTIEGQHFITVRNLMKFALLKPRIIEIPFLPLYKFNKIHYALYFNLFSDLGYVVNKYDIPDISYSDKLLFSAGAGFDLVTYYDRTFRAEYSINGFGKAGFYFHLTAPINK